MATNNITLTESQARALDKMKRFVQESDDRVFALKGYAGTGKTTLMRFLISYLEEGGVSYRLLSTTGRAAKILSNYTGQEATTIHSMVYSYQDFNKDLSDANAETMNVDSSGQLFLVFAPAKISDMNDERTIYIIDEASMVSDTEVKHVTQAQFGSGRLLKELLEYDSRKQSKFIFVGDPCQLPPIDGDISPALEMDYVKSVFGIGVQEATLTEIMRQKGGNTIVDASKTVRSCWNRAPLSADYYNYAKVWAKIPIRRYPDIHLVPNVDAMRNDYVSNIKANGYNDSVMICRSNADCHNLSIEIRKELGFTGGLQKGDLLMVIQNQISTGLMNGDMVEVVSVGENSQHTVPTKNQKGYYCPLSFREITVKELFTGRTYTTLLIENTINMQQNNLDSSMQTGLFLDFILRMKRIGITQKHQAQKFKDMMLNDPYLNALRCSYGYAITCHKAQGGEWNKVYVYSKRNMALNPTKKIYQWIYTAITRGKKAVYMIDDFYIS